MHKKNFLLTAIILITTSCGGGSTTPSVTEIISPPSLPEETYLEHGLKAYERGLYSLARDYWTQLRDGYPSSYYASLAELKIADSYFFTESYSDAIIAYEEFIRLHPGHEAIPYVKLQIGKAYQEQYIGADRDQVPLKTAISAFKEVIDTYPNSTYARVARSAISECREQLAQHELFVAAFYAKQELVEASASRVYKLTRDYADTQVARAALDQIRESRPEQFASFLIALEKQGVSDKDELKLSTPHVISASASKSPLEEIADLRANAREQIEQDELIRLAQIGNAGVDTRRFRLKDASSGQTSSEQTPVLRIISKPLCEVLDGGTLITAELQSPLKILRTTQANNHQMLIDFELQDPLLTLTQDDLNATVGAESFSCNAQDSSASVSLKLRELKKHNAQQGKSLQSFHTSIRAITGVLELNFSEDSGAKVFTLDRPDRLVAVVLAK